MENLLYIPDVWRNKWGDTYTPFIERTFYRLKATICLLLNRSPGDIYDGRGLFESMVQVAVIDSGVSPGTDTHPTIYWCDYVAVGRGLFRHWWVVVDSASSD